MVALSSKFVGAVLAALTVSTAALAQSYYDDQACRQFADTRVAPLRDQANSQGRQHPAWRRPRCGVRCRGWRRSGRRDRGGFRSDCRHRSWCSQRAECGGVPAAAIQRLLCAVHGLSEVSDTAICRTRAGLCTGAGLWTGPRLRPPAGLSATGFVPASVASRFSALSAGCCQELFVIGRFSGGSRLRTSVPPKRLAK